MTFARQRRFLYATVLFGAVAFVLCIIMALHSLRGAALVGCGAGSSCDSVLSGRWSAIFGFLPVSALAASVYMALIACCICLLFVRDYEVSVLSSKGLLVLSGAILGSAVWFAGLMVFEEGEFCKYCVSVHGIGLVVTVLILIPFLREVKRGGWFFSGGVCLAAVLALFQILTVPDYVYQQGRSEEALPLIEASDAPIVGEPDAEYVIDLLFDYQCSHCQKLHGILPDVVEEFGGKVAFVLCPCPLSPKCNPYVPREETHFEGSCDLAMLALALYSVDSAAFEAFDSWLFSSDGDDGWYPRQVADARAKAESLVGEEVLSSALSSQFATTRIARTAELFGRTSSRGQGGIPRFICGDNWLVPEVDSVDGIVELLTESFSIR